MRAPVVGVVAVALIAAAVLAPVAAGPTTRAEASTHSDPVPLYARWSATSKLYQNADGTTTAEVYSSPIQVPDPASDTGWSDVDTSLQPTSDGLAPEATTADVVFSDGTDQSAPLATVSQDDASLSVVPSGDVPVPSVSGDTATYDQVMAGVDETLQAKAQGYEVNFVVDSPADAPDSLEVPLSLDGLSASLGPDGSLVLTDASGTVVGGAEPAQMWGSATDPATGEPAVQQPVPTALTDGPDGPVLVLTPDPSFYTDPDAGWPITIDPAVNLSLSLDSYVNEAAPTSSYGSSTQLLSGRYSSGGGIHRGIIAFDRAAIAGTHVISATLTLHETDSATCTASQVDVVQVTSTVTGAPTWNNQPTVGGIYASASAAMGHSGSCPAGDLSLSTGGTGGTTLADLVQLWSDGTTIPAQLELRAHNESSSTSGKVFTSSDAGSNGPVLSVTYNSFPDVPTYLWTERDEEGSTYTLHGTFSDPDPGATGSVAYTVTDDAVPPDVVASGSGPVVASGADSPWDVPAGAIEDGVSYTFTAVASDGTDSSAPTDSQLVYHDSCPDLDQIPAEERPTHIDIAYKIFDAGGPGQYAPTPIYMDEWVSPGDPPAPAPALFILHGGGWTYGCRRSRWHEAYTYSRPPYNFDVFGIDYRLACTGDEQYYHQDVLDLCGWPYQALDPGTGVNDVAAHDLEDAIGYLKDHASSFPAWDGQNIGALGSSAGGTVLLDAIADANAPGGSGNKPQVSATWSASMEMASMDQAPDDGFFSADGCDHARGYVTPLAQTPRDYMVDCWFATDRYLSSVNPDGTPRCGLTEVDGLLVPDPYVNHISRDSSDCEADLDAWWYSSPYRIWQAQQATETDYGPVFIANGGGDDAGTGVNNDTGDYAAAETVALEEPLEFYNWLRVNSWTSDNAHLCVVDTTMHGHKYEDMPCDDNLDSTVLTDTGDFFLAHLSS